MRLRLRTWQEAVKIIYGVHPIHRGWNVLKVTMLRATLVFNKCLPAWLLYFNFHSFKLPTSLIVLILFIHWTWTCVHQSVSRWSTVDQDMIRGELYRTPVLDYIFPLACQTTNLLANTFVTWQYSPIMEHYVVKPTGTSCHLSIFDIWKTVIFWEDTARKVQLIETPSNSVTMHAPSLFY